jgi:hypothetical protein
MHGTSGSQVKSCLTSGSLIKDVVVVEEQAQA